MNNYELIKQKLVDNEIYKKVKDCSKNKSDLKTYYDVGKMLAEDGKHYGEKIIKKYSERLTKELGKGFTNSSLKRMRQFYLTCEKGATLSHQLTWSHYIELLPLVNIDEINYYINNILKNNLSIRELRNRIKTNEYQRLDIKTIVKFKSNNKLVVSDLIKNPILLNNSLNKEIIKEKTLKKLILEDMDNFLEQLGHGFCYIKNEYKIKIGNKYNYIDLLLYNIEFNCYVVIELKVTELKKEHIGQIEIYMNYIDSKIKKAYHDKTIGIIITKQDNKYIMEYCSDPRVFNAFYQII